MNRIVFLPTAQYDEKNPWLPNDRGILRIKAAVKCLEEHPDAIFVIGGGYANHRGVTYADRMAYYISQHHPDTLIQLELISGFYNRTIDDIFQGTLSLISFMAENGKNIVPAETEFNFCSERLHYLRTELTIRVMGFEPIHVESHADDSLYSEKDVQMAKEFVPGKILGLGKEALEWNQKAFENAKIQAEFCQQWAIENPELDQIHYRNIRELLLTLSERGVLIQSPAFNVSQKDLVIPQLIKPPIIVK